jgi:hypothetical protein
MPTLFAHAFLTDTSSLGSRERNGFHNLYEYLYASGVLSANIVSIDEAKRALLDDDVGQCLSKVGRRLSIS